MFFDVKIALSCISGVTNRLQLTIGIVAVDLLTSHQVLFIFHVLAIMANLRPQFVFRQGGEGGKKIGVKLTMWGHTVTIDPSTESTHAAKVAACRRALELIQEDNPKWMIPPQPIDGLTTPDWNWIWMLDGTALLPYIPKQY